MPRSSSKSKKSTKPSKTTKARAKAKKGPGKGWHKDSVRHKLARYGISTTLPDGRRLDVSKFLPARGKEAGKLPSEIKTPEMGKRVLVADKAILKEDQLQAVFEHGHWWVTDFDGNIWDAVDASGPGTVDGFDMELVSEGDEEIGSHWRHQ